MVAAATAPALAPICRVCGTPGRTLAPAQLGYLATFDPATGTYVCQRKGCRAQAGGLTAFCRRCPNSVHGHRKRILGLKSLIREGDRLTYLCWPCQSHDKMRAMLAKQLADAGVPADADQSVRSQALLARLGDGRQWGRPQPIFTEQGLRRKTAGMLLSDAQRGAVFRLCPYCRKLIYLRPSRLKAGALGFHGACYRAYRQTEQHREWRKLVGSARSPRYQARRRRYPEPLPHKGPGRAVASDQLAQRFRWLIRQTLLRQSLREIAALDQCGRSTVSEGIAAFVDLLPNTWTEVYGGGTTGKHLDDLLPIARLRT
jgi:hypothetical protein